MQESELEAIMEKAGLGERSRKKMRDAQAELGGMDGGGGGVSTAKADSKGHGAPDSGAKSAADF